MTTNQRKNEGQNMIDFNTLTANINPSSSKIYLRTPVVDLKCPYFFPDRSFALNDRFEYTGIAALLVAAAQYKRNGQEIPCVTLQDAIADDVSQQLAAYRRTRASEDHIFKAFLHPLLYEMYLERNSVPPPQAAEKQRAYLNIIIQEMFAQGYVSLSERDRGGSANRRIQYIGLGKEAFSKISNIIHEETDDKPKIFADKGRYAHLDVGAIDPHVVSTTAIGKGRIQR